MTWPEIIRMIEETRRDRLWFREEARRDRIHGKGAWAANPEVVAITFTVHDGNIDAYKSAREEYRSYIRAQAV